MMQPDSILSSWQQCMCRRVVVMMRASLVGYNLRSCAAQVCTVLTSTPDAGGFEHLLKPLPALDCELQAVALAALKGRPAAASLGQAHDQRAPRDSRF